MLGELDTHPAVEEHVCASGMRGMRTTWHSPVGMSSRMRVIETWGQSIVLVLAGDNIPPLFSTLDHHARERA
jgi:hypothetical protein